MHVNGHRSMAIAIVSLTLLLFARAADASVGFKADSGWAFSTDGFINAFAVDQFGTEKQPAGIVPDTTHPVEDTTHNVFRLKTGLLPGLIAFNVESPDLDGLKLKGRVGFYPQINNNGANRNSINPNVDLREAFVTIDGSFGQVLAGRAINLYQSKNILTDMTLFGVGALGSLSGDVTIGRIGFGYLYPSFGAQMRYTTPDFSGLKFALQVGDPNAIMGTGEHRLPEFEGEISYAAKAGGVAYQAWVEGIFQKTHNVTAGNDATGAGGAAGVGASFSGLDLLASGFYGQALGSWLIFAVDALDAAGKERKSGGFLAQATYAIGATKLGVSYGQNTMQETASDTATRAAGAQLDTRRSIVGGLYHDVNKNLKLVAEYTWLQTKWFNDATQHANVAALGGFFFW